MGIPGPLLTLSQPTFLDSPPAISSQALYSPFPTFFSVASLLPKMIFPPFLPGTYLLSLQGPD